VTHLETPTKSAPSASGQHHAAQPVLPYLWMLLGSLAFSAMATLTHGLGSRCDWELVATVRAGLALSIAALLVWRRGARFVLWRPGVMWIRSISGTVSLLCTFYALPRLPISDVLTLTNMFPIWVALLSWPLLGEIPRKDAWLAIAVGLLGVVLVAQPHLAEARLVPAMVAVAASFSTSVAMMGLHRLRDVDPWAIVAHFSGVAFVTCLAVLLLDPKDSWAASTLDTQSLAMLAGVGLCATIGQFFLTKAFAAGPPARVSVVALTQVAFAMAFDVLIWHRTFDAWSLGGILLVMAPTGWLIVTHRRGRGSG